MTEINNKPSNESEPELSSDEKKSVSTDTKSGSNLHLQLANQELYVPINHWTFLMILVLVLGLVGIEFSSKTPGSITQSVVYGIFNLNPETNVVNVTNKSGSIYEFWTPSIETPTSFRPQKAWDDMKPEKKRWYTLDNGENTLRIFGQTLMDLGATGYSHVESHGQGTSVFKQGLLWEVTFPQHSAMTPRRFIRVYNRFFHRDKNIYLKISGVDATRVSRDAKGGVVFSHEATEPGRK